MSLRVSTVSGCVGFCGGRAYVRECRSLDIQHYVSLTRAVERRHFFVLNRIEARPTAACRSTHFLSAHQVQVFTARPCNPNGVNRSHRPGEAHSCLTAGRGKSSCDRDRNLFCDRRRNRKVVQNKLSVVHPSLNHRTVCVRKCSTCRSSQHALATPMV